MLRVNGLLTTLGLGLVLDGVVGNTPLQEVLAAPGGHHVLNADVDPLAEDPATNLDVRKCTRKSLRLQATEDGDGGSLPNIIIESCQPATQSCCCAALSHHMKHCAMPPVLPEYMDSGKAHC